MLINYYDGACHKCKCNVKERKGFIRRSKGKYVVYCGKCHTKKYGA